MSWTLIVATGPFLFHTTSLSHHSPKNIVPLSVMSTPLPQPTSVRFPARVSSVFPNPSCLWVMLRVLLGWEQHLMLLLFYGKSQEKPGLCDSEFGSLELI